MNIEDSSSKKVDEAVAGGFHSLKVKYFIYLDRNNTPDQWKSITDTIKNANSKN